METRYWEISDDAYQEAHGKAWSLESMEAHLKEKAGYYHRGKVDLRPVEYIGSREKAGLIWDYYRDDEGDFWYKNRWRMPDGHIVSMEEKIYGEDFFQKDRRRQIDSERVSEADEGY